MLHTSGNFVTNTC